MRKLITLIILFAFFATLFTHDLLLAMSQSSDKYSLAVLNLFGQGTNLPRSDVKLISRQLNQEIALAGLFFTMSHQNMERGLLNKGLDVNGCATIDCAVRAGRALGVQLVVIGTITQTGSTYVIDAEMVHVASREVVKSLREDMGSLDAALNNVRPFARKFLGLSDKQNGTRQYDSTPPAPKDDIETDDYYKNNHSGGGFKWGYVGLGLLIAGGTAAGVLLLQNDSSGGNGATPPTQTNTELPGPPTFP